MRKMEPEQIAETVEEIRNPKPKVTFPSGQIGKNQRLSAADRKILEQDSRTTDKTAVVEYGKEDLLEELRLLHDEFFDKYLMVLDIHRDVATDNSRAVIGCLKEFETRWKNEVKEIFK